MRKSASLFMDLLHTVFSNNSEDTACILPAEKTKRSARAMSFSLALILLFVIISGISNYSLAQAPVKTWDKTLGGVGWWEYCYSVIQTTDGGYLVGGYSDSPASVDKSENCYDYDDYWVVKLDANGNKTWDKTVGGSSYDDCHTILQTEDGGYLLVGSSGSPVSGVKTAICNGGSDYWIVKLDASGNKLWDKSIGGADNEQCMSAVRTMDGGYLLGGWATTHSPRPGPGNTHYWIVKLDANGDKTWDKSLSGNVQDQCYAVTQTKDGNYVVGGYSWSNASGDKTENSLGNTDYWIVKLNANGNKIWDRTLGGSGEDMCQSVTATDDGGCLVAGYSSGDFLVIKLNVNGAIVWEKSYGGNSSENCQSINPTADGGYLLGGSSYSNISGDKTEDSRGDSDYWIVKIDADGNKIWDKTIGADYIDVCYSAIETADKGYLLGGYSVSGATFDKSEESRGWRDYWIVKLGGNEPPVAICKNTTLQLDANGQANLQASAVDGGSTGSNITLSISPNSFNCSNLGENSVVLTVTDDYGESATCTAIVTVMNDSPVIESVTGPVAPLPLGAPVTMSAVFTDNNIKDATWYFSPDGLNYTISYPGAISGNTVTGSFNLTSDVYSVKLVIGDYCGATAEAIYKYVVVYDPNGGFVTGGGWINSPKGAYVTNPELTGKANFGFVSKYKKGSNVPNGNTEFQFHSGNLNFSSSSYDLGSLVISGAKAKYKGVGTINGAGNYGFMVSVLDGDVKGGGGIDKFRIKIWDQNQGNGVVYDNDLGIDENNLPTTALGGGSIVIHNPNDKSLEAAEFGVKAYPNPFTDHVYFDLQLKTDSKVRLEIYDIGGSKIATLFDNVVVAYNLYRFEYAPEILSTGILIYRLTVDGKLIFTDKLIHY